MTNWIVGFELNNIDAIDPLYGFDVDMDNQTVTITNAERGIFSCGVMTISINDFLRTGPFYIIAEDRDNDTRFDKNNLV